MFGLKSKTKEIEKEKNSIDNEELNVSSEEEVATEPAEKFNLAWALGKTKEKMEKDFYLFQIKELMKKLGFVILPPISDVQLLEKQISSLIKFETGDILATPTAIICLTEKKSALFNKIGASAIVDYPYGESTAKSRYIDVKELAKHGIKNVVATLPVSGEGLSILGGVRSNLNKMCAKLGKGLSIGVHASLGDESVKKIMKTFASVKAGSFTLLCGGMTGDLLTGAVVNALKYKADKKLFVFSDVGNVKDLAEITELGVDKVYTPYALDIGNELLEKFDVSIE